MMFLFLHQEMDSLLSEHVMALHAGKKRWDIDMFEKIPQLTWCYNLKELHGCIKIAQLADIFREQECERHRTMFVLQYMYYKGMTFRFAVHLGQRLPDGVQDRYRDSF